MTPAACLALVLSWAPGTEQAPRLCNAVLAATTVPLEQRWLLVVAIGESNGLDPRVLDCRKRGDRGRARGAWQVHPRSAHEAKALCRVSTAAPIALARIRESEHACRHQPPEWRHAAYAAGSCTSSAGRRISAVRYARVHQPGGGT